MNLAEQQFSTDLEKKHGTAADKLRSKLNAAVYKHVALGLRYLKYVSVSAGTAGAGDERVLGQAKLTAGGNEQ